MSEARENFEFLKLIYLSPEDYEKSKSLEAVQRYCEKFNHLPGKEDNFEDFNIGSFWANLLNGQTKTDGDHPKMVKLRKTILGLESQYLTPVEYTLCPGCVFLYNELRYIL